MDLEVLRKLLTNIHILNDPHSSDRKLAAAELQTFQKESQAAIFAYNVLFTAADSAGTPSILSESHPPSPSSRASTPRDSFATAASELPIANPLNELSPEQQTDLYVFCAQTLSKRLKSVLTKPAELRAQMLEPWMTSSSIYELANKLSVKAYLKNLIATCLGHAIVIQLSLGNSEITEVLDGMLQSTLANHAICLNAIRHSALSNASDLLSAPQDGLMIIRAIGESLKFISTDANGGIRQMSLKVAASLCKPESISLLEQAAAHVTSHPSLLEVVTRSLLELIEIIEEFAKTWSQFAIANPLPYFDFRTIVDLYPTMAEYQSSLINVVLLMPPHLCSNEQSSKVLGVSCLNQLNASIMSITAPIHGTIKTVLSGLKNRSLKLKPSDVSGEELLAYYMMMSLVICSQNCKRIAELQPVARELYRRLQYCRAVVVLELEGPVAAKLIEFGKKDNNVTAQHKELQDKTFGTFFQSDNAPWVPISRTDDQSSTPQELLGSGYQTLNRFSESESSMSDEDLYDSTICWTKYEWVCSYALATYIRWLTSVIQVNPALYVFGALLCGGPVGPFASAFCKYFISLFNVEINGVTYRDRAQLPIDRILELEQISISEDDINNIVNISLETGFCDRCLIIEEAATINKNQLSPLLLKDVSPLDGVSSWKDFGIGYVISNHDDSKSEFEYAVSSLNDAVFNALRDYGVLTAKVLPSPANHLRMSRINDVILRGIRSSVYPLSFARATSRIKRSVVEHREEIRRNIKTWTGSFVGIGMASIVELFNTELLTMEAPWRVIESTCQVIATMASLDARPLAPFLENPVLLKMAQEHRAVLRQYLSLLSVCTFEDSASIQSALKICRASWRVPQADPCYPMSSMQDHMGVITLAKVLSMPSSALDVSIESTRSIHADTLFLTREAVERGCKIGSNPPRGTRVYTSIHSLACLAYCCGRYISLSKGNSQEINEICDTFTGELVCAVSRCLAAYKLSGETEVTAGTRSPRRNSKTASIYGLRESGGLIPNLIKDIVHSLAVYYSLIVPVGTRPVNSITRYIGMPYDVNAVWQGQDKGLSINWEEFRVRSVKLCQNYPELVTQSIPIMTTRSGVLESYRLLTDALLGSALVQQPDLVEPVLKTVCDSPMIPCLQTYLKSLTAATAEHIERSLPALDCLIQLRFVELLTLTNCSLSNTGEIAMLAIALTDYIKERYTLFKDRQIIGSRGSDILLQAFGVATLGAISYTHALFSNSTGNQLNPPLTCINVMADLLNGPFGDPPLDKLGSRFIQGVHAIVSDTQLKAASKGSEKSRESITPSAPTPAQILSIMTPNPPLSSVTARVLATVALMTLISAEDASSSVTLQEVNASIDVAPRILDAASVDAAARYLARALPFDMSGVALPAVPYKWAASEDAIKQFMTAVRNAASIRKTLRSYCGLLNVIKRRGSRGSSSLLLP